MNDIKKLIPPVCAHPIPPISSWGIKSLHVSPKCNICRISVVDLWSSQVNEVIGQYICFFKGKILKIFVNLHKLSHGVCYAYIHIADAGLSRTLPGDLLQRDGGGNIQRPFTTENDPMYQGF